MQDPVLAALREREREVPGNAVFLPTPCCPWAGRATYQKFQRGSWWGSTFGGIEGHHLFRYRAYLVLIL